jgi:hypothetical protein
MLGMPKSPGNRSQLADHARNASSSKSVSGWENEGGAIEHSGRLRSTIVPTDELIRLGEAAVAELERRGYDVRGKSAAQIKKILRFPPPKRKSMARKRPKRL